MNTAPQYPTTLLGAAWLLLQAHQGSPADMVSSPEQQHACRLWQALAQQCRANALNDPKYPH